MKLAKYFPNGAPDNSARPERDHAVGAEKTRSEVPKEVEEHKSYLPPLLLQKITGDPCVNRENEMKAMRKVYVLWLRVGSFAAVGKLLGIDPRKVNAMIHYGKRKGIIKHQWRPRREYPRKETIKKITRIRDLYEEHGTLQSVADHIGCTKQRVHQILAQGKRHGLFDEMPSSWKCKSRIASNVAVRQSSKQKMES